MKTARAYVFLGLAMVPMVSLAQIHRLPTDTELKAGYCLASDRTLLENFQAAAKDGPKDGHGAETMTSTITALTEDIQRLNAYVSPKLMLLDTPSMSQAAGRGIADVAGSAQESEACRASAKGDYASLAKCMEHAPASTRLQSCIGATFLPY